MTDEVKDLLKDLILINSIIATEIIQITENTSKIARKSDEVPPNCVDSHTKLRSQIIELLKKYFDEEQFKDLSEHVIKH
ncbi:MAG: hypothetical protein ACTSVY_15035 [Candidatus Helarchaeota archaeon]